MNRLLSRTFTREKSSSPQNATTHKHDDSLPPLSPVTLKGYSGIKRKLMSQELSNDIRNLLPPRLQLFDEWELVYSMEKHGMSLNTLYSKCNLDNQIREHKRTKQLEKGYGDQIVSQMIGHNGYHREAVRPIGFVLIIRDNKHNKFGCYLNEYLRPMEHKRYYGNGECFLWKLEKLDKDSDYEAGQHRFKAFMYTGINDNIIYSNHDFIAIGSSNGQNGLWISSNLSEGVSYKCETFGNEVLNGAGDLGDNSDSIGNHKVGKFNILGLEIWRIGTLE